MALSTFVKINSVNNLSDARYGAGMEVNQMGFCLEQGHERYLVPQDFIAITEWISGVTYVGEFYSSSADQIIDLAKNQFELEWVEITEEALIAPLREAGLKVILQLDIAKAANTNLHNSQPDLLHVVSEIDSVPEEQIPALQDLAKNSKMLLGFGLEADNIHSLLESIQPEGISLSGGDEIRPGFKDYDALADILEALETEV